ncbi:MAG: ABC transporter ATP-binding protein [Desulfurococcaceae archaeon]
MLEVKNVSKIFFIGGLVKRRKLTAVKDVSINVGEGEIISLVGESGSGKSTLARMILRLIQPTSGSILFQGLDIWRQIRNHRDLKWYWKNVNAVFQDPYGSFHPTYKIKHCLNRISELTDLDARGMSKDQMIKEACKFVGLKPEEVLERYPFELSGGMLQRVLIARILLIKPKIVVADEPTSMLDAALRLSILDIIRKLRDEEKMSVIFITHDLSQALYVSDRIVVMYEGSIVEETTPSEILSNNIKHQYTRSLLDSIPKLYISWFRE